MVEIRAQMKSLTVLLISLVHESFHSQPCLGLVSVKDKGRYGLVFALPADSVTLQVTGLDELIKTAQRAHLPDGSRSAATLQRRCSSCTQQGGCTSRCGRLTSCSWPSKGTKLEEVLQTTRYIVGYNYARPDTPDAAKAVTQLPESSLIAELYRHPQARGADRQTYQKRFDMYSLGCLTVELMTWESLEDLHSEHTDQGFGGRLAQAEKTDGVTEVPSLDELMGKQGAVDNLEHQAGSRVVQAARR